MNEELKIIIKAVSDEAKKNIAAVKKELQEVNQESQKAGKAVDVAMRGMAKATLATIGTITALTGAMAALGKKAQEVEKGFAKLNTTFQNAGSTTGQAAQTYKELFSFLGDHDKAIETAQSLALISTEEEKLAEWTNILQGAYAEMGDKLPIEGLAEAANETINVGQATGVLADALNWAGVSEDGFNAALAQTASFEERETLVRNTLNGLYGNAAKLYAMNNQATIQYNQSQANLNITLAQAAAYTTPLLTSLNNLGATMLTVLGPALQIVSVYLTGFIQLIAEAIVWVGNFFGIFSSKTETTTANVSGYREAMKKYLGSLQTGFGATGDGINSTINKVKELKKQTMGFDELNVVSSPTSTPTGGAGAGGGASGGIGALPEMPNPEDFGLGGDGINLDKFKEDLAVAKEHIKGLLVLVGLMTAGILLWKLADFLSEVIAAKNIIKMAGDNANYFYQQLFKEKAETYLAGITEKMKYFGGLIMIAAGAVLLVKGYSDSWVNGIDWANFAEMLGGIALIVGGLALAFGPLAAAIGLVVGSIALVVVGIKDLITNGYSMEAVITVAIGVIGILIGVVWALNAALLANPITWIVVAVLALVAVFVILWNECEAFRNFWINLWDSVSKFFTETVPAAFNSVVDWFKKKICEPIANFYNKWIAPVVNKIIEIIKKLVEIVGALFTALWNLIKGIWNTVANWFNQYVIQPIANIFSNLWNKIKEIFAPVVNFFSEKFQAAFNKIKQIFGGIGNFFLGLWNNIKSAFSKLGTMIGNAIGSAVKAGINGVISLIEKTINKAIKLINGGIDLINLLPGVKVEKVALLQMPRLARGGIATSSTIANIGEAGKEAVLPLENNTGWMDILADRIASRSNVPSKIVFMVDGRELGWASIRGINGITKQTGSLQLVLA